MDARRVISKAWLLAFLGCATPFAPPEGTVRIDPPPEYRLWWEASRECVDKPEVRRFEDIEWYVSEEILVLDGRRLAGLTEGNRVYLSALFAETPMVIQHELVHAVNGISGHPDDPFVVCHLMP